MSDQTESPTIAPGGAIPETELAAVRDLVLKAHPNVVPELVRGVTVAELTSSIPAAEAAYQRIAAALTGEPAAAPPADADASVPETPPAVPSGAGSTVLDLAAIPPGEKIRRGLEQLHRAAGRT